MNLIQSPLSVHEELQHEIVKRMHVYPYSLAGLITVRSCHDRLIYRLGTSLGKRGYEFRL